jgi:hypothetical protein|tara:strand:+ start:401 stop:664 length:264 start_codon:yes stop_codon:yes gene_type:complete
MAYKPKKKQKQEVKEEIIEVLTNKTKTVKGKIFVDGTKLPDPKLHQLVSFVKSGMRIIGYCFIPYNLGIAALILVLSEVVGIIEELV